MSISLKDLKLTFSKVAKLVTEWSGSIWASFLVISAMAMWVLGGLFYFGFGETYQLVLNSVSTILTTGMVFLIQHSQNRDSKAVQIKLDEIILSKRHANNAVIQVENLTEEELKMIHDRYLQVAKASAKSPMPPAPPPFDRASPMEG
jgi:low affinity Fe/Cu permease